MIKNKALALLFILLLFTSCSTAKDTLPSSKEAPPEESTIQETLAATNHREDLQTLYETLLDQQPHFNGTLFNENIKAAEGELASDNDLDFYFAIRKLLSAANDAHTKTLSFPEPVYNVFPLWGLQKINNCWYVIGIQEPYQEFLGWELTAINGTPMAEIELLAAPYISYENSTNFWTSFAEELKTAEFLQYIGAIDAVGTIPVTFTDSTGQAVHTDMQTFASDDYTAYTGAWLPTAETARNWDHNYYFTPLEENILFIQYNVCRESEENPPALFLQSLLEELDGHDYKGVLFDLRYNQGGSFDVLYDAIDTLGKKREQQGFQLYCLIGEQTFSAGVMHAVQLKELGAIIAGRPTGGNVNFYADTLTAALPHTGIEISFSTQYIEMIPGYTGGSLMPDIETTQTIQHFMAGTDHDVQTLLNIIQGAAQ